jgi:tetratricopeptide (TPR) repeat protein
VIQDGVGAVASATTFPWGLRIANAAVSLVAYGQQTFWPAGLAAFYPWNWSPAPHVVAGAALLLLATSAGALIARRRRPYLMVGWAWFLPTVLPVIGLIQSGEQSRGDRFMYVPLVGLAIAVAWGIESLLTSRKRRIAAVWVSAGVLTACAATTYRQSGYWQNDVTLWERALAVTEGNYLAHDLLGVALEHRGDYAEALAQYSEALRLAPAREPDFAGVVEGNIGRTLLRQGKPSEAQAHLDAAVRLYPSSAEIRYDRGEMLLALRQYPAAASEFRAALAANHPRPSEVQNNLGLALFNTGRLDDALSAFVAAVQTDSSNARAENGIGLSLSALGQDADALTHYDAAIRLRPDFARAHANLGMALQRLHRSPEALNALLEAVRLDPSQPAWHFSAAVLLAQSGRLDEAREHFERVIALEPDSELGRRAQAALR